MLRRFHFIYKCMKSMQRTAPRFLLQPNQIRNSKFKHSAFRSGYTSLLCNQSEILYIGKYIFDFMIEVSSKANICSELNVVTKHWKYETLTRGERW